ncbi:MAG TPA: 2-dehydropantoate 2-reductase [Chloroflexota bacterium]
MAIWGVGAIGGTIGAWMSRAGVDVLLVDNEEEHVREMQQNGLLIDGIRDPFRQPLKAVTPDEVEGSFDLIFLAVKCRHTNAALDALVPHLTPEGAVVSLQNGLNEETIALRIGADRTIGCFLNFGADYMGPGHVQHANEHPIYVGELDGRTTARIQEIHDLLVNFCETNVTHNIWGYLWSKLAWASVLFGTAMVDAPSREIFQRDEAAETLFRLGQESIRVPLTRGIHLEALGDYKPGDYRQDDFRVIQSRSSERPRSSVKNHTGIWRDLAVRHRPTEVDCQVGALVRHGHEIGLKLPMNERLIEMVHEIERGRRPMAWENITELGTVGPAGVTDS